MMVVGKDDLGLSLSLGSSSTKPTAITTSTNRNTTTNNNDNLMNNKTHINHHNMGFLMMNRVYHLQQQQQQMTPASINLMMMPSSSSSAPGSGTGSAPPFLQKLPWNRSTDSFSASDRNSDTCRSFLRGIDVNMPAGGGADEEEAGASSPNSTVSSASGKRCLGERDSTGACEDNEVERASSRSLSDDEEGGDNSRKKLRLSKDQSAILEESFKEHNTLNPKQKLALAKRLGLRPRQVEVWFQNRRARTKLKQTEVDCEFLKRCCEQLTEENRWLQKEVKELRAYKLSPHFYMQMTPPTTLNICPSCERVAVPPSSTSATPSSASDSQAHHRPLPVKPWVAAPVPIQSFEALQPRS